MQSQQKRNMPAQRSPGPCLFRSSGAGRYASQFARLSRARHLLAYPPLDVRDPLSSSLRCASMSASRSRARVSAPRRSRACLELASPTFGTPRAAPSATSPRAAPSAASPRAARSAATRGGRTTAVLPIATAVDGRPVVVEATRGARECVCVCERVCVCVWVSVNVCLCVCVCVFLCVCVVCVCVCCVNA